jgi:hypothetical protein
VVVLDVIDAAAREFFRQGRELLGRQALRLERGAGQGPLAGADFLAQFVQPVARTAEPFYELARNVGVVQHDIVVDRRVAEQHVDELAGILPDGLGRKRDAHLEDALFPRLDRNDPADDLRQDGFVLDRRHRHFDALLDRDGAGAVLDRGGIGADAIDGFQSRGHG